MARSDAESGLFLSSAPLSGKASSYGYICKCLCVLQNISSLLLACNRNEFANEQMFFSSLGSVNSISDCILRKLRGLLMVVSLDCTKLELLEEVNWKSPIKKSKEKPGPGVASRRKKGKTRNTKKQIAAPESACNYPELDKPPKVPFCLHRFFVEVISV